MSKICLAPLAGVTNLTVREFFTKLGADLTHTEMISCEGLIRDNPKTLDMLKISDSEAPLIIQLFASNDEVLYNGAENLLKFVNDKKNFYGIGVNMACPMPKVTKNGSGAALLKRPDVAFNMIKKISSFKIPVWVKIRKLENNFDTLKFVEMLLNAGADNVCIHGRTEKQRYEGKSDKKIIFDAAKEFPGKISASGDVWTVEDIKEYFSYNCENVMLARGAITNPYLFCEFHGIFKTQSEKINDILELAERTKNLLGEHKALVTLKKFSLSLAKGFEGGAEIRNKICQSKTFLDAASIINQITKTGES